MKKKFISITNMAAPYQVKFCYDMQNYYDTEFWFYTKREKNRPKWWEISLGDKCKIMKWSFRLPIIGYVSLSLPLMLIKKKPDLILLGGFMKYHVFILFIAKLIGIKVAIYTEAVRKTKSDEDSTRVLMTSRNSKLKLIFANILFKNADLFIGMGEVAKDQLINEFKFKSSKVYKLIYPQDLANYFAHPLRIKQKHDKIILLFANRLVDRYNPIFALQVLKRLNEKFDNIELLINSEGPLKEKCSDYIKKNDLKNASFLNDISNWNDLHIIYKSSDILFLPAEYSNGNGSIIEACASGMGIVVSDQIHNVSKHLIDNVNCYICPLEIDKFVESISKYINNTELLKMHGQRSKILVEDRKNEYSANLYYTVLENMFK